MSADRPTCRYQPSTRCCGIFKTPSVAIVPVTASFVCDELAAQLEREAFALLANIEGQSFCGRQKRSMA